MMLVTVQNATRPALGLRRAMASWALPGARLVRLRDTFQHRAKPSLKYTRSSPTSGTHAARFAAGIIFT